MYISIPQTESVQETVPKTESVQDCTSELFCTGLYIRTVLQTEFVQYCTSESTELYLRRVCKGLYLRISLLRTASD